MAAPNSKKVVIPNTMAEAGIAVFKSRPEIELAVFDNFVTPEDYQKFLKAQGAVHAAVLGATKFSNGECDAANGLQVVARIGVGFDAVDVPALTKRRIPLMTTGTANSPSVAEAAMFMMLTLAKRGAELDTLVKEGRWKERLNAIPMDLNGKTLVVVGCGRIGSRTTKRAVAMEMDVHVYDPFVKPEVITALGATPVKDLDAALAKADFVSIHCPKTPETTGMFNAARIGKLRPHAYLVNTARGGIVDEPALHAALTTGKLAGAGVDVFATEPPSKDHPLFALSNVITAPHMAGVTKEAMDRMARQAAENVLSVFDGKPNRDNVINKEVLG